jgi:hypothetical protein
VGVIAHGKPLVWLTPLEGEVQRWQILRALALVEPAAYPLAELLVSLRPTLRGYTSLVLITPNGSSEWLKGLLPLIWLGAVPTVLLLDPVTFAEQAAGVANPAGLLHEFSRWGIHHHLITPDLLDRPEASPGHKGEWQWRISPTGRAVALNPAMDAAWRDIQ